MSKAKFFTLQVDPVLQLSSGSVKIEANDEMTVRELLHKGKLCFDVPYPNAAEYRLFPKNYEHPLEESERVSKTSHVCGRVIFRFSHFVL